jgi:hypothetical protein
MNASNLFDLEFRVAGFERKKGGFADRGVAQRGDKDILLH